jgi:hypothetical protein
MHSSPFYLNNILVDPDIIQNLLSDHHFTTNNWCSIEFDHFGHSVKDISTRNVITRCIVRAPLHVAPTFTSRCCYFHDPSCIYIHLVLSSRSP